MSKASQRSELEKVKKVHIRHRSPIGIGFVSNNLTIYLFSNFLLTFFSYRDHISPHLLIVDKLHNVRVVKDFIT